MHRGRSRAGNLASQTPSTSGVSGGDKSGILSEGNRQHAIDVRGSAAEEVSSPFTPRGPDFPIF